MKKLSETASKIELGVYGKNTYTGDIRADEFQQELKGKRAIQKYKEMRDGNPIVGAVMYAVEQTLIDVLIYDFRVTGDPHTHFMDILAKNGLALTDNREI